MGGSFPPSFRRPGKDGRSARDLPRELGFHISIVRRRIPGAIRMRTHRCQDLDLRDLNCGALAAELPAARASLRRCFRPRRFGERLDRNRSVPDLENFQLLSPRRRLKHRGVPRP